MLYRRHVRSSDDLPNWQNIEKKDRKQGAVNSLADRLTSLHAWHLYWLRHPETLLSGHCERNVAFWTVKSESLLSGHRNFAFWMLSQKHCCLDTMRELLLSGHSHKHCFLDTESETLLFGHWQECCFLHTIISFAFWTLSQKLCYLDTVTEVFLSGHSHKRCFLDTWVRNIELTLLESKMFHRVLTLTEEKKKNNNIVLCIESTWADFAFCIDLCVTTLSKSRVANVGLCMTQQQLLAFIWHYASHECKNVLHWVT